MDTISKKWLISEESFDDEQIAIKSLKPGNYLIDGCAGSGKTVLALTKAFEIQEAKLGTYLVVIFTHTLKAFIKDGVTNLGLDEDRICMYDQLKKRGYTNADYIIVDEVQDFQDERIQNLVKMANKHFMFFGDDAQQIFSDKTNHTNLKKIAKLSRIDPRNYRKLYKNYRLPKPIAEFAAQIPKKPNPNIVGNCVNTSGKKPFVFKCKDFNDEMEYIKKYIQNNGLLNVGILVTGNAEAKKVVEYYDGIKFNVQYKYYDLDCNKRTIPPPKDNLDFYDNTPKIMTYHSSKGLQFDHVFLPMCNISVSKYDYQDALYVAVTRASEELHITYSGTISPFIKKIAPNLYD